MSPAPCPDPRATLIGKVILYGAQIVALSDKGINCHNVYLQLEAVLAELGVREGRWGMIDTDKIQRAAEEMYGQFVSHPPHKASFMGGVHAGAVWAEHELAQPEPINARLLAAASRILKRWDRFAEDGGCVNPLDYLGGESIEPLRAAIADAERAESEKGGGS